MYSVNIIIHLPKKAAKALNIYVLFNNKQQNKTFYNFKQIKWLKSQYAWYWNAQILNDAAIAENHYIAIQVLIYTLDQWCPKCRFWPLVVATASLDTVSDEDTRAGQ